MSYRLIPHHIYCFSDIEICIVWRKIGVWRGTDTSQSQYLSHFIYPNSSLSGTTRLIIPIILLIMDKMFPVLTDFDTVHYYK